ncbi:hypothetical protein BG000_010578 [Podila horticola]|nr:hypothetical protein BG000_010578 [Podila horticola]
MASPMGKDSHENHNLESTSDTLDMSLASGLETRKFAAQTSGLIYSEGIRMIPRMTLFKLHSLKTPQIIYRLGWFLLQDHEDKCKVYNKNVADCTMVNSLWRQILTPLFGWSSMSRDPIIGVSHCLSSRPTATLSVCAQRVTVFNLKSILEPLSQLKGLVVQPGGSGGPILKWTRILTRLKSDPNFCQMLAKEGWITGKGAPDLLRRGAVKTELSTLDHIVQNKVFERVVAMPRLRKVTLEESVFVQKGRAM